jgi:GxxExxY protein
MNRAEINRLHTRIFEAASEVYTELGQGLDLQIYYTCFLHELRLKGLLFKRDVAFPVYYKEIKTNKEIFAEILVENQTIVELKSGMEITEFQMNAMLSKLKIAHKRMGIIITFNAPGVTEGYRKVINSI